MTELKEKYNLELINVKPKRHNYRLTTGLRALELGDYWVTRDSVNLTDMSYFSLGYRMDGGDLIYLTSEASGELTTLDGNTIMSLAVIDELLYQLKRTRFAKYFKPILKQAVGDDCTILVEIIDPSFTADDVANFLDWITGVATECGLKVSIAKTHLTSGWSEFVQTHASLGLYIPKDHITVIASKKPRNINDPISFMESLKRLMLTKVSRGYS